MHHGVIFSFCSAKVYSPAIFETCFSHDKDIWIAATIIISRRALAREGDYKMVCACVRVCVR